MEPILGLHMGRNKVSKLEGRVPLHMVVDLMLLANLLGPPVDNDNSYSIHEWM